ncbi:hypothetical protein ACJMK2_038957 [Sinanodonta woodiana]|uniref:C-type lectin domain-containing protein n=1 Tax=Sinanodonta woodiana TaxID=1069815 RepID=A0ABD3WAL4_SINWO
MKFPIVLLVLGLLSNSRITNFAHGSYVNPPPPVPLPVPIVPYAPQGLSAGFLGFGSIFGVLAILFLVSILPALLRPKHVTPACPTGYYLYSTACGRFCYRYESNDCKSWSSARATCIAEGGDLLVPSECYYKFFKDNAQQNEGNCTNVWLGGSTTTPGYNFTSVRGEPIPDNFSFWNTGQPDPARETESCLEMRKEFNNYRMNDYDCSVQQGFICQKFV